MADDPADDPKPDKDEGKTFTQADVDRIVADRLNREKGKFADYDELKAKADKLDEQEAASKSDLDKAREQLAAAEKRATDAEARADRLEVVVGKALDEDTAKRVTSAAKRLVGSTREELEADADELISAFPTNGGGGSTPPPGQKPRPDLKGGTDPDDGTPEENDPAKLAASVGRVN